MSDPTPILSARDLALHYAQRGGRWVRAVNGVSFDLHPGETLAIVGESGCGKSSLSRALMRLEQPTAGKVRLDGADITHARGETLRQHRRHIQMVFQDPYASLDPRMSAREIVREPLDNFAIGARQDRDGRVIDLLERVGLSADYARRYAHEMSGGQRQRLGIARALAAGPKVLIADEPVSALDISIQAQVINLLGDIQKAEGLSILFISHDINVVAHVSDRIAVMYLGRIVEIGRTEDVLGAPQHPYTRTLLDAVPVPHPRLRRARTLLEGDIPSPSAPPPGCTFHPRCPQAMPQCRIEAPELIPTAQAQLAACHLHARPSMPSTKAHSDKRLP